MKKFFLGMKNEMLKQKRGCTLYIVLLTPLITVGINFVDLFLRYDYLKKMYKAQTSNPWDIMLLQNHFLWVWLLSFAILVISGMIHYIESSNGGWRYILSLPIKRKTVYVSKWFTTVILSFAMIFIHIILMVISGYILGFKESLDLNLFFKYALYECIAVLGIASIQILINSRLKNIIVSMTIGFIGVTCAYFFAQSKVISILIPYTYEIFTLPVKCAELDQSIALYGGIVGGILLLIIGILGFSKKDIL